MGKRILGPGGGTGPTPGDLSRGILEESGKSTVRRLDPDQFKTTVQVIDPVVLDAVGIGQLRFTGSSIKSATFDSVERIITLDVVPRFDITVDFGVEEQSFS